MVDERQARRFLTCGEAGRLADPPLTPDAIRAAAGRNQLRVAATTADGTRLFDEEDVLRYLDEHSTRRRREAA